VDEAGAKRVDLGRWAWRVLTWDAIIPVIVGLAPLAGEWLFPGRRDASESIAVYVPILALFFRGWSGKRSISTNACAPWVRVVQFVALCVGLLPMLLMECLLTLPEVLPRGLGQFRVLGVFFFIYLLFMVLAMYPGRTLPGRRPEGDEQVDEWWARQG
jgi:hypothetical protein